jgi:ribosomal protein S18 acetylase RimI-like enzyme
MSMKGSIRVRDARLEDESEVERLFEILDAYARGPGGQSAPLSREARENLGRGLLAAPHMFVLFGLIDERIVGAAVCLWGYSTFGGRPFVNLHDFSVLPEAQNRGVGSALMAELESRARQRGCCKITLEVNDSNEDAKRLYARSGFGGWSSPTWFVAKRL